MRIRLTALLMSAAFVPAAFAQPLDGPLPPDQVLKSFKVEPGLKLELVAAEPLVVSPCAVCWDERGRMFVAENRGYPTGPKEGEPPQGRVTQLLDKDGDGRMDERVEFATELSFPNGLMPWRGGLIVTCSPDVLFLKDTDGDGKADEKKVLLTGFSTKGSTQLRVSHPMLALDGWVYLTSGLTGGEVVSPLKPDQAPVKVGRTDIRFKPDTGEIEPCDGGAQFGQTFDDFGRRFICYNRVQVQHVVLESKFLKRNPHLAFAETVENCPAEMADEPLKGHGKAARIFPISSNVTTADSHAGTFTAACAVTIYRGTSLPSEYYGTVFSCDPTGNLVHVDKLVPHGATFRAHRMHPDREVLASTDNWFRPVFLANAPDGALYVCDMYRQTIEHPDYLPVEIRKRTDFNGGKTMGRIYRMQGVAPEPRTTERVIGGPSWLAEKERNPNPVPKLNFKDIGSSGGTPKEWFPQIGSDDGWWRDTMFRMVIESPESFTNSQQLIASLKCERSIEVALAIAVARTTGEFSDIASLSSSLEISGARQVALWLMAEPQRNNLKDLDIRSFLNQLATMVVRERILIALSLADDRDPNAIQKLARIGLLDSADRWARAAVLSSIAGREYAFLQELIAQSSVSNADARSDNDDPCGIPRYRSDTPPSSDKPSSSELFYDLGRLLGASKSMAESIPILSKATKDWPNAEFAQQVPLITGLVDGLRARGFAKGEKSILETLLDDDSSEQVKALRRQFEPLADSAAKIVDDSNAAPELRRRGIEFLAHAKAEKALPFLSKFIESQQPEPVQMAAIKAVVSLPSEEVAGTLLTRERFTSYSPRLREEIIGSLASTPRHVPGLLTALESGVIPAAAIDTLRRRQLAQHKDPAVKERATKIFGAGPSGDRAKVYEEHKSVLTLTPNAENGRAVFKRACSSCHRLDREGTPVGPDLFGIRNQPKEAILLHILVPEHEITPGFTAYIVTTKEGRVLTGLISSETATSITLKQALGKEETILRQDIEELASSNLSLMPQGVEKTVNKQEFADLLSYLKGEK